jgi:glutathione S-transferase
MLGEGGPDPAEVKRGEALVAEHAPVLDAHLAGKTWVAQDGSTWIGRAVIRAGWPSAWPRTRGATCAAGCA